MIIETSYFIIYVIYGIIFKTILVFAKYFKVYKIFIHPRNIY